MRDPGPVRDVRRRGRRGIPGVRTRASPPRAADPWSPFSLLGSAVDVAVGRWRSSALGDRRPRRRVSRRAEAEQAAALSRQMRRTASSGSPARVSVDEIGRLACAFGVRPVRAQQQPVDPDVGRAVRHIVLPERRHPDVLAEHVARMVAKYPGLRLAASSSRCRRSGHPHGAVLDAGHAQPRESLEDLVAHGGAVEVRSRRGPWSRCCAAASGTANSRPPPAPTSARGRRSRRARRAWRPRPPASAARPQNAVVHRVERRPVAARHRDRCVAHVDHDGAGVEHGAARPRRPSARAAGYRARRTSAPRRRSPSPRRATD